MRKFDLFRWTEIPSGSWLPVEGQALRLRLSEPAAVYVRSDGYEVLLGYGVEFENTIDGAFEVLVSGDVRAFALDVPRAAVAVSGQVLTNVDRLPHESGAVLEVKRALRELQLERRAMRDEMRALARGNPSTAESLGSSESETVSSTEGTTAAAE